VLLRGHSGLDGTSVGRRRKFAGAIDAAREAFEPAEIVCEVLAEFRLGV
jgi:hypothetical protein